MQRNFVLAHSFFYYSCRCSCCSEISNKSHCLEKSKKSAIQINCAVGPCFIHYHSHPRRNSSYQPGRCGIFGRKFTSRAEEPLGTHSYCSCAFRFLAIILLYLKVVCLILYLIRSNNTLLSLTSENSVIHFGYSE